MKITAVLFDLDGTLYPIDTLAFETHYLKTMADAAEAFGYPKNDFLRAMADGTKAIKANDGSRLNRDVFVQTYCQIYGVYDEKIDEFFDSYFSSPAFLPPDSAENPLGREIVADLKKRGFTLVLATNPFSPRVGTLARLHAAGISERNFDLITVMENSSFCKPKTEYYQDIAEKIGKRPEECLMVGNDVGEDMAAGKIGMKTYLVTDCLTNRNDEDCSPYRQGSLRDFAVFAQTLS